MLSCCVLFGDFGFPACPGSFGRLCLSGTCRASRHLICHPLMCGKPKQRLDVRKTVACTQADNSQVTTLFMHASNNSRCFQLSRRAAAFCSGTTGAGRHNAAASKSARTPSLRLLQPRVPPASACRGRRTRTTLLKRLRPRHSPRRRQFDRRHNGSTAENAAAGRGNPGAH